MTLFLFACAENAHGTAVLAMGTHYCIAAPLDYFFKLLCLYPTNICVYTVDLLSGLVCIDKVSFGLCRSVCIVYSHQIKV